MSTATRKPLTKTKQAQLILEGTAASMAVVLTLWLLLWFLWQSLGTFPVEVLFIPDRDLPFQRADAEAFLGKTDQIESSSGSQILRAVETLVAQPNQPPLLLMISVPAFGVGPDARLGGETGEATVESLIRTVARKAQRKVLLALDLAQIDSDLSRHLYGNSPFNGLEQWLHEESFDDQNQSIWVLCASASGQKSWTADGLGRSIFAYYLEKGISGAARPWDHSPGGGRVVTVEGLARYVRKGVRTWVDEHRSKAIQTPVLMKVGHRSDDFAFSGVLQVVPIVPETKSEDTPKPADPESLARGKSKEGEKAPEKSSPPRPAREILMDDLFQEWGEHDRLRNIPGADPIFRWLPNGWKKYESDLLNAEQLVRASEIDPSLQPSARDAIRQAGDSRRELTNQHKEWLRQQAEFPFQPLPREGSLIRNDRLRDLLRQLTGSDIQLEGFAVSPVDPPANGDAKPPESRPAGGLEALPDAPKVSVVRLEESWAAGPWPRSPEPFLELQFPIWAGRFTQFYHLPSLFEEPNRGSLLKSAVLARINGESAMALDRRGLEHIFPDIAAGDAIRRELQDGLFSLVPITNPDEPQRQITHYRDLYETALRHITLYHQSRALVERMAAEVPYYAEWEILASARQAPAEIQDGPLPSIVDEVLAHSARLLLALEGHDSDSPEAYFDNLELKHREAESRFHKIRDHYLGRANNVVSNVTRQVNLEFRELDELLTTPLLPPDQRRKILERVVSLDRIGPSLTPPSDADLTPRPKEGPSADPGFFRRALGLAALDTRLLNLGLAPGEPLPVESVDRALQALTELQTATPDYASGSTARNFATLSRELSDRTRLPSTASSVSVLTKLQNAERASRFAGVGREANLDDPVGRLEQYALRRALERHAERLALDYAPANQVSALYQEAANLFPDEDVEPLSHPLYRGVLEPLCSPDDDPLRIGETAELDLTIQARPEADSRVKIPPGRAFVGLLSVPPSRPDKSDAAKTEETSKLILSSENGSGALRDLLLGGLVEVGTGGPSAPVSVHLKQILQRKNDSGEERFLASVFYRGRVGKDEPRSQQPVTVSLAEIKAPLHIQISHDLDYLKGAFPRDWNLVRDPFQNRQEDAYIHFHKDLHYQLTFVNNRASDPISVTYHRVLVSQGAGEKNETELDRKPITLTIKPGGKIEVPGLTLSWTAFPSPEENQIKPRDLEVRATVSVDGGEPLEVPPLRLRLHQIHLRDYMTFETEVGPNSRGVRSWIVHGERSFQDPVTEPILLSEISAYIGGTLIEDKKGASILVNPHLEAPRNTLDFHVPVTGFEPGGKVKWSAKIENEKVEGEISSH